MVRRAAMGVAGVFAMVALVLTATSHAQLPQGAPGSTTKADADSARQKFLDIAAAAEQLASGSTKPGRQARRTTITQNEINSYLAFDAGSELPTGVVEPSVNILGDGRLSGRAVVDLDAVRKASPSRSFFDPRSFLRGHLPLTITGVLRTHDGAGQFQLESASLGSVPIPKAFVQEIVSYYTKGPDRPSGLSLDDPLALPVAIKEILINPGQAVVVQ